jgi:hypothetical protein
MSNTAENKATVAKWLDAAFNNPRALDQLDDLISNKNALPPQVLKASWQFLHAKFSNVRAKIVDQVAEGDKVFTLLDVQGDAGGECRWHAYCYHRLIDGRIVDGGSGSPASF